MHAVQCVAAEANWESFGRGAQEDHYSPLTAINDETVNRLRLAWWLDLPPGNSVTAPVEFNGTLYVATGYSIVRAIVARTGHVLWTYDPKAPQAAGLKLRQGWGIRGLSYSNGKLYFGTQDGRLIAVDAKTGKPVWSVLTVDPQDVRFISGPPRAFNNKVVIGHAGSDVGSIRGYVDCYDARTGKRRWRFYTVPGNPADGFENKALEMAAKTWSGEWWKYGGGGTVWNSMTYDAEFNVFYLGVGNGAPWNRKIRSAGQGDNLFLASVVAVDADTGAYKWHYQENPGESWDFDASIDMELATLVIDGEPRKVLMTAPKNGFFYVIDRTDGKLISAEPFAKVTWASKINIITGRPIEAPNIRYDEGGEATLWPGPVGAHSWPPMSFNVKTGLVYIPTIELPAVYKHSAIDPKAWQRTPGDVVDNAVDMSFAMNLPSAGTSYLQAWDPIHQHSVWRVPTPSFWNGGTMTTGGNLVFQGQIDAQFNAYAADSGKLLWSYDAQAAVIAPPISYSVGNKQYVTVLTGNDTSGSALGVLYSKYKIDYRSQKRRILTFALDGGASLPVTAAAVEVPVVDPTYRADEDAYARGMQTYGLHCVFCHGATVHGGGHAPDLRYSSVPPARAAFEAVVRGGALIANGMPRFEELADDRLADLRQYIRAEAEAARKVAR